MKLSDGNTRKQRKQKKKSGEHIHAKRVNRVEYSIDVGTLSDHMNLVKGLPTNSASVGRVNKKVAKSRGTF